MGKVVVGIVVVVGKGNLLVVDIVVVERIAFVGKLVESCHNNRRV